MGANSSTNSQTDNCSSCELKFHPFTRRKRVCLECQCLVCSDCLRAESKPTPPQTAPPPMEQPRARRLTTGYCQSCIVMRSSDPTHHQLNQLKVKHLKGFLVRRNVQEVDSCVEKTDLIELILERYGGRTHIASRRHEQERLVEQQRLAELQRVTEEQQLAASRRSAEEEILAEARRLAEHRILADLLSHQRVHPSGTGADSHRSSNSPSSPENRANTGEDNASEISIQSQTDPVIKQASDSISKISLSEIESEDEVDTLSVKQLKMLLVQNLVDYKGCKEKHELITKVKMLWQSRQANKRLYEQLLNPPVPEDGVLAKNDELELCKICMDSTIDCVLLNCGHMVACTKCGKQLNECPICRQFVVKAVHTFRA